LAVVWLPVGGGFLFAGGVLVCALCLTLVAVLTFFVPADATDGLVVEDEAADALVVGGVEDCNSGFGADAVSEGLGETRLDGAALDEALAASAE
jgi:hypothetical protein